MSETGKSDESFNWDAYLEATGAESVPPFAFQHVNGDKLLGNYEGLAVEFRNPACKNYWPAEITLQCGPLVRLRWLGDADPAHEHWGNLRELDIKPIGFAASNGLVVQPTPELAKKIVSWPSVLREFLASSPPTLPSDFFEVKKPEWAEIRKGMCVEIRNEVEPYSLWPATVEANEGGRLKLTYLNCTHLSSFWLFYTSHRIRPVNSSQTEVLFHYKPPCQSCVDAGFPTSFDKESLPSPARLTSNFVPEPHGLKDDSKVEAISRVQPSFIQTAIVHVLDEYYFQLEFSDGEKRWSHYSDPYVLPIGFAKRYSLVKNESNIDDNSSLNDRHLIQAEELGMAVNAKLEAVHPCFPEQIHVATIVGIHGHLIKLKYETDELECYSDCSSCDIFPVDWHKMNGFTLYSPDRPSALQTLDAYHELKSEKASPAPDLNPHPLMWCPAMYFNFRCYVGPWLSRLKLSALPKSVGPGPVNLVLKEVLTLLLGVAYKPGWVLKQLHGDLDCPAPPGMYMDMIKARYKNSTYRGLVPLASHVGKVPDFCRLVASRLQICPRLISFQLVGDSCPEQCRKQTKVACPPKKHGKNAQIHRDLKRKEMGEEELESKRSRYSEYLMDPKIPLLENGMEEVLNKKVLYKKKKGRPPKVMPGMGHPELPPLSVFNVSTNPLLWNPQQVYDFVQQTECGPLLAHKLLKEEVDGKAFLLLTLPTVLDFLTLSPQLAMQLCAIIASLRYTYVKLYMNNKV